MMSQSLGLSDAQQDSLRQIGGLMANTLRYESQQQLIALKDSYRHLDPDSDTRPVFRKAPGSDTASQFCRQLEALLIDANYDRIAETELKSALERSSLVKLRLDVDFDDFERILFYGRGESRQQAQVKSWFGLKTETVDFSRYDRVVILFSVKPEAHFANKPIPAGLAPGATLLKMFRNVPKADLEMLFPNTEVRMRLIDKLVIGVPAVVSGAVVLTTKLGSTLLLIGGLTSFWLGMRDEPVVIDQTALIALAIGLATLGGFVWKQLNKFKYRKIEFLKTLTDNLYFRNLDNNAGVVFRLVDEASEEEFKEAFLAYGFLFAASEPMSPQALDEAIEDWFLNNWKITVNFEIDDAIAKLRRLGLVHVEIDDRLSALPADAVIDHLQIRWRALANSPSMIAE